VAHKNFAIQKITTSELTHGFQYDSVIYSNICMFTNCMLRMMYWWCHYGDGNHKITLQIA